MKGMEGVRLRKVCERGREIETPRQFTAYLLLPERRSLFGAVMTELLIEFMGERTHREKIRGSKPTPSHASSFGGRDSPSSSLVHTRL